MKTILSLLLILGALTSALGQGYNYPNGTVTSVGTSPISSKVRTKKNEVINETILKEGVLNESDINVLAVPTDVSRTHTYTDGIGRVIQQVAENVSPTGADMVQIVDYDNLGRSTKKYLPFTKIQSGTNRFVNDDLIELRQFYLTKPNIANTGFPYAESVFEKSPLDNIIKQGAPGETWKVTGAYTQKILSRTNWTNEVKLYQAPPLGSLTYEGFYEAKKLYVAESSDEHNNIVRSYTNAFGKPVLKRVYAKHITTDTTWADTYFVYDGLQRLRYVLSPEFHNSPMFGTNLDLHAKSWAFIYLYDEKGRKISEHVPGTEGVKEFVYDKRDRLILSRTQAQADSNLWTFYKHDALNRVVMTGIYKSGASRLDMVNDANYFWDNNSNAEERAMFQPTYYTQDRTFPVYGITIEEVYYYDQYFFEKKANCDFAFFPDNTATYYPNADEQPLTTDGKAIGTRIFIRETNASGVSLPMRWKDSFQFYDIRNRVRQTKTTLFLDNTQQSRFDIVTNQFNFAGALISSQTKHESLCNNPKFTIWENPQYDAAWRPIRTNVTLMNSPAAYGTLQDLEVPLNNFTANQLTYNELGQVISKKQHSEDGGASFLQDINYKYNIRGWLTHINDQGLSNADDLFGMQLHYDKGFSMPQYNGNIAGVRWKSRTDNVERAYGYQYDKMNRLITADYVALNDVFWTWSNERNVTGVGTRNGNYSVYGIEYDLNGNILKMKRNGLKKILPSGVKQFALVDDLTYHYEVAPTVVGAAPMVRRSNRLLFVDDAVITPMLAPDFEDRGSKFTTPIAFTSSEYQYDRNGNLISDKNKKIENISYNSHNQDTEIRFEGNRKIINFRDGSGAVYKKEVWDNGVLLRKTEYSGRFVYEQGAGMTKSRLSYISMPEGRLAVDSARYRLEPEYHYTDHLGNLRLAYRNQTPFYEVTAEPARDAAEETFFANLDTYRTDLAAHQGNNALKSGMIEQIVIPVVANEKLKLSVFGMARCNWGTPIGGKTSDEKLVTQSKPTESLAWQDFLAPALGFSEIHSQGVEGKGTNQQLRFNLLSLFPLAKKLFSKKKTSTTTTAVLTDDDILPESSYGLFMRIAFYNTSGTLVQSWTVNNSPTHQNEWVSLVKNIQIPNESGVIKVSLYDFNLPLPCPAKEAFFDDFRVQRLQAQVFQENHYDPWGLNLKGIEENDAQTQQNISENRLQSNGGGERETFFDLQWLETPFRPVDAQIGRMWGVDAMAVMMPEFSPFVYSFNNPILFNDPTGLTPRKFDDVQEMVNHYVSKTKQGGSTYISKDGNGGFTVRTATVSAGESMGDGSNTMPTLTINEEDAQIRQGGEWAGSKIRKADNWFSGEGGQAIGRFMNEMNPLVSATNLVSYAFTGKDLYGESMGVGGAVMAGIDLIPGGKIAKIFRSTYRSRAAVKYGEDAIKGMDIHHIIPQAVYKKYTQYFKSIGFDIHDADNLIPLEPSFHKPHPQYNKTALFMVESIIEGGQGLSGVNQVLSSLRSVIIQGQQSGVSKLDNLFK